MGALLAAGCGGESEVAHTSQAVKLTYGTEPTRCYDTEHTYRGQTVWGCEFDLSEDENLACFVVAEGTSFAQEVRGGEGCPSSDSNSATDYLNPAGSSSGSSEYYENGQQECGDKAYIEAQREALGMDGQQLAETLGAKHFEGDELDAFVKGCLAAMEGG
jgi:hypothetical protein